MAMRGGMLDRPKKPTSIDEYVGNRVRIRRNMLGITQKALGDLVGVTFQQIQKYEKGKNRIGVSRLVDIAACLDTSASLFLQGAEDYDASELSITHEGIELATIFAKIGDPSLRKQVVSYVRVLACVPISVSRL